MKPFRFIALAGALVATVTAVASNLRLSQLKSERPHCPEVFSGDTAECLAMDPVAGTFFLSGIAATGLSVIALVLFSKSGQKHRSLKDGI